MISSLKSLKIITKSSRICHIKIVKNKKGHYRGYKKISRNALVSLIKSIEKTNYCDSKTAYHLLKSCGLFLIDLAPHKRQRQLDYLFTTLLRRPQINLAYQVEHYETYMTNSFVNEGAHFCPFEMSRQMRRDNVRPNVVVNSSLVERLCSDGSTIDVALNYVTSLVRPDDLDVDLERFRSSLRFDDFVQNVTKLSNGVSLDPLIINAYIFNPIISFYLRANESSKAIRLVQLLDEISLPPNSSTYSNLISGYMYLKKFDEAKQLVEKTLQSLSVNNVFDLQLDFIIAKKQSRENDKNACNQIQEMLFSRYPYEFQEAYTRLLFVNMLSRLCRHNEHETAFNLSKRFFKSHFIEDDPTKKDIIHQSINIANYFYKSLVEYSPLKLILKYTNDARVQSEMDKARHVRCALHHSLLCGDEKPIEMNLALVKEITNRSDRVKLNYFMPLIIQQIKRLDESEIEGKRKLKDNVEFKRIESLIRIIKFEFGCEIGDDILNQILSWLRFDANNVPKSYINFTTIVDLFKSNRFNSLTLFKCCAYKILNYRMASVRKNPGLNLTVEDVRGDFDDFCGLFESLRVTEVEFPLHQKLNAYLSYLIKSELDFIDFAHLENDPVVKTFRLLNERACSKSLIDANRRLNDYLRRKGGVQEPIESLKSNPKNFMMSMPKGRVSELEKMISYCEESGSDARQYITHLISLICAQPNLVVKPVSYLEELVEKKLDQSSLTSSICQDLMVFYSKFTLNRKKADEYFEKMVACLKKNEGGDNFRPENILSYVEFLLANREPIPKITNVFRRIKPASEDTSYSERDTSRFENQLTNILVEHVYVNSNSKQLQDLVEAIFESKLIDRTAKFPNLVMCKHIETNKHKEALDYYQFYLSSYRMSLLEVPLLQLYFRRLSQHVIKLDQMEQVLNTLAKIFDENLANNMVFFAHVLNGDFKQAYSLYSNELKFTFDLNFLELLSKQFNSNPILKRHFSPHLRNILRFNSHYGGNKRQTIENDIKTILDKF